MLRRSRDFARQRRSPEDKAAVVSDGAQLKRWPMAPYNVVRGAWIPQWDGSLIDAEAIDPNLEWQG